MGRKRHSPKNKKINPKFWVFCEGKTENKTNEDNIRKLIKY